MHEAVAEGSFRPDLYFRLRVVPLQIPALRERVDDIELLVEYFLQRAAQRHGIANGQNLHFSATALRALKAYNWPGNVRELENAVEYALALRTGEKLDLKDLPTDIMHSNYSDLANLNQCILNDAPLAEVEKHYILRIFERYKGQRIKHLSKSNAVFRADAFQDRKKLFG